MKKVSKKINQGVKLVKKSKVKHLRCINRYEIKYVI